MARVKQKEANATRTPRGRQPAVEIKPYKELAAFNTSTVDEPVKVVKQFLSRNPKMERKTALNKLVGMGVSFGTAKTQYQKFHAGAA